MICKCAWRWRFRQGGGGENTHSLSERKWLAIWSIRIMLNCVVRHLHISFEFDRNVWWCCCGKVQQTSLLTIITIYRDSKTMYEIDYVLPFDILWQIKEKWGRVSIMSLGPIHNILFVALYYKTCRVHWKIYCHMIVCVRRMPYDLSVCDDPKRDTFSVKRLV